MEIIKKENPCLREKSVPVLEVTDEIKKMSGEMLKAMYKELGIGLSAPQVGTNIRMFVTDFGIMEGSPDPKIYINPVITEDKTQWQVSREGCLSFPGETFVVMRPYSVEVKALNENGEEFVMRASGINAAILLHEQDNLDGILVEDRDDTELLELVKDTSPKKKRKKKK